MTQLLIGIVVGLIAGLLIAGLRSRAVLVRIRGESDERVRAAARAVARGGLPEEGERGSAESDLRKALEQGWAPREEEHRRALSEALGHVGRFLERTVEGPLEGAGLRADADELRERIGRALGGLEDLKFFLEEPGTDTAQHELGSLAQQVTREFASDQGIGVRMSLPERPLRVQANGQALMDVLYLVLHNAGRFGAGSTVDVKIAEQDHRGVLLVEDRGPGFTDEALERAFDPFYSTVPDGLGLGLHHARRVLEGMGGRIELRNRAGGGAQVELSLPLA